MLSPFQVACIVCASPVCDRTIIGRAVATESWGDAEDDHFTTKRPQLIPCSTRPTYPCPLLPNLARRPFPVSLLTVTSASSLHSTVGASSTFFSHCFGLVQSSHQQTVSRPFPAITRQGRLPDASELACRRRKIQSCAPAEQQGGNEDVHLHGIGHFQGQSFVHTSLRHRHTAHNLSHSRASWIFNHCADSFQHARLALASDIHRLSTSLYRRSASGCLAWCQTSPSLRLGSLNGRSRAAWRSSRQPSDRKADRSSFSIS